MVGDFNCIENTQEKQGGKAFVDGVESREFRRFIEGNGLVDLGFVGLGFTWCNNHHSEVRVWKRIDRAFAGANWIQIHLRHQVLHLSRIASDHRPLLISTKVAPFYRSPL